jgi:hypothetical protein
MCFFRRKKSKPKTMTFYTPAWQLQQSWQLQPQWSYQPTYTWQQTWVPQQVAYQQIQQPQIQVQPQIHIQPQIHVDPQLIGHGHARQAHGAGVAVGNFGGQGNLLGGGAAPLPAYQMPQIQPQMQPQMQPQQAQMMQMPQIPMVGPIMG